MMLRILRVDLRVDLRTESMIAKYGNGFSFKCDSRPGTRIRTVIIFDLTCGNAHRFEGWFESIEAFERQLAAGRIGCPTCNSTAVRRVPSAVHIGAATAAPLAKQPQPMSLPEHPLALYHQLVTALVAHSEDTGDDFANEARRIHQGDAPVRAIHGQSSAEDFAALRDEGIEVWRLPIIDKDKLLN